MNSEQKLQKLGKLREKCISEDRRPTESESSWANKLLLEIELDDCRDMFHSRPAEANMGIPQIGETRSSTGPFNSLGDQLLCIRNAAMPGSQTDPRLYQIAEQRAATGLSESVPSSGGFFLQDDLLNKLLQNIWNNNQVINLCTNYNVSGTATGLKIIKVDESSRAEGYRSGGIKAYWLAEADEKTASKPKFGQLNLSLKKLAAICYTSDELLADVSLLDRYITDLFTKEFDFKIADGILNGSGAGQMAGILTSSSLVQIVKEAGQNKDSLCMENILKAWARHLVSDPSKVVWIAHRSVIPQLYAMSIGVGVAGQPIFMPAGGVSGRPYNTLLGSPVVFSECSPELGDLGDLLLADMSQYFLLTKGGIQKDISMHCRFIYDESVFRFVLRLDGQPATDSAVTPKNGTDTLSPFVAIAERA